MHTIRLRISDKIYKNLMWFLSRFHKEELEVIEEDQEFISIREYLRKELSKIEEGSAEYITLDQLDKELENTISKYEA